MQTAIDAFNENMRRVRALHTLYLILSQQGLPYDLSDLLRAEIVMAVSALDHFVHELTRLGMLECWSGQRTMTDAFQKFPMAIATTAQIKTAQNPLEVINIVDTEIRTKNGWQPFQNPERIAEAIRLFSSVKLWDEVGKEIGRTPQDAKSTLVLICDRRNKIAHEADMDPSFPGARWPINTQLVEDTLNTLDSIAQAIYKVAA